MKFTSLILVVALLLVTTPFTLAQSDSAYKIEMMISKGDKSKQVKGTLLLNEESFNVTPKKDKYQEKRKTFRFNEIESAEYSYAKKPLLSVGGAITTTILLGLAALPLLFMKKKRHWLSVRNQNSFAIIKLQKSNFRQIIAEFETRGVDVKVVTENDVKQSKDKKEKDKKDKNDNEASAGEGENVEDHN